MRFRHRAHPGRVVRLAYCLNAHPAASVEELLHGLATVAAPLRDRVAPHAEFGLGMYVSARVARELLSAPEPLAKLRASIERESFDPFTYNAFPHGGFGESGLKQRVFEPTWWERARAEYTLDVARIACELRDPQRGALSISTHTGGHRTAIAPRSRSERLRECAVAWSDVGERLDEFARRSGHEFVLGLEPEPDSLIGSIGELEGEDARAALADACDALRRRLGVCYDACHAAVMFEDVRDSLAAAARFGAGVAKVQITSALALREPTRNGRGREALLALDEPRYLHQLAARSTDGAVTLAADLPEARERWGRNQRGFADADEWRCHFHVPVDLRDFEALGLQGTRGFADRALDELLQRPASWPRGELHVEIETYTWSALPDAMRGAGALVDSLEREYAHVIGRLESRGWRAVSG